MAWLKRSHGAWYVCWREAGRSSPVRSIRAGLRKTAARRIKVEVEARVLAGRVGGGVLPKRVTFRAFAERWIGQRTTAETTLKRDQGIIRTHLLPVFGPRLLTGIEPEDIRSLVVTVSRRISPYSASRTLAVLRKMLADAEAWNYMQRNPAWGVKAPPLPDRERFTLSVQHVCELLEAMPAAWRPFVLSLVLAGLRFGEARGLKWPDVGFDENKIHVRRQIVTHTQTISSPKRSSRRSIDLLPPLRQALLDLPQRSEFVFPGIEGGPIAYEWFMRWIWRLTLKPPDETGQERLALGFYATPHDLRHFFGSLLLAWGEPDFYIAAMLGHRDPTTTRNIYLHEIAEGRRLDREATLARIALACGGGQVTERKAIEETIV